MSCAAGAQTSNLTVLIYWSGAGRLADLAEARTYGIPVVTEVLDTRNIELIQLCRYLSGGQS